MSTPKTSFYLTNGTHLVDLYPLESNGVGNQSIPNEIFDMDYSGSGSILVAGDLTERLIAISASSFSGSSSTITCVPADFSALIASGLQVGMFVDVPKLVAETSSPLPNRTTVTEINEVTYTVTLSNPLSAAISSRTVNFCYAFDIIDLDPSTPSPYVGSYGVASSTFDGRVTTIALSPSTPIQAATFDIMSVVPGSYGMWIVQGVANAREVFYANSTLTVSGNGLPAADGQYHVSGVVQSDRYNITGVVKNATTTTLVVSGNVEPFFAVGNQLKVAGNTTHNTGAYPLNNAHNVVDVQPYNVASDTTSITIATLITGVSGIADGNVAPVVPVALITVSDTIPNGATASGVLSASSPIQQPFAAPPAITPVSANRYIVSWRVSGDWAATFAPGHSITVKNNNYCLFNRLTIDSINVTGMGAGLVTEIRTTITDTTGTTPVIGQSGFVVYPSPAVPYGHIQYTVADVATPLELVGKGVTHFNATTSWGQALQNNAIHQLENFANDTPPASPLEGQLWFDTSVPALNLKHEGGWDTVVVSGMPVQADIDMNGNSILNLADAVDPTDAVNLRTADARFVNVTGDVMTGSLDLSDNKITSVADTDVPVGALIDTNTPNGQDALNMRTADARYVNVDGDAMMAELSMGGFKITHAANPDAAQDVATKSYVDSLTTGIVWLQPIRDPSLFDDTLATPPVIADGTLMYYRSFYVKPTQYPIDGVNDTNKIWSVAGDRTAVILPGHKIVVRDNLDAAANGEYTVVSTALNGTDTWITVSETISSTAAIGGFLYHAGGAWNGKEGRVVAWDGSAWVDVLDRPVAVGDRFGVFFEVDNDDATGNTPGGSFAVGGSIGTATQSAAGKIVTVNAIADDFSIDWTSGAYPVQTPAEPDAVSVLGVNSPHYGHSYTFRGNWGTGTYNVQYKWIEFAGPSMLVDGAGLKYSGNVLNVGAGTGITVTANAVNLNTSYINSIYMRRDGATAFTGPVSMGGYNLISLADPVNSQDAVNLRYLQDNFLSSTGASPMEADLNMGGFHITNLGTPVNSTDAATMGYADTKVSKSGDTMTGALSMSNATGLAYIDMGNTNKIINLADPTNVRDAVNLQTADGRFVKKGGDTMTGVLTLSADPTQAMHASTKQYVDNQITQASAAIQSGTVDGGTF